MLYPYIEDYKDSFRNPDNYFDKLKPLFPVNAPWDDTMPYFITGGFAVVFKIKDANGKYWAFKCFTQEVADRKERLKNIAEHLQHLKSPYFVDFRYFENELWVCSKYAGDKEYPVVMMEWIEGVTLGKYINQLCQENNTSKLYEVLQKCVKMFAFLLDSGVAHGDLKHDNILVKPNGDVVLVDYDGMYVSTLWYKEMVELGSPSYQHPNRQNNGFNPHLDHFSMLVMLTSLYTLYVNPSLKPNQNTDTLFFQKEDFLQPRQSPRFQAIASLQNPLLDELVSEIKKVLAKDVFLHIPPLKTFLEKIKNVPKNNVAHIKNIPKTLLLNLDWWNGLGKEWQLMFYAHIRLWKEKGILVTDKFRKEKEIEHYWNIFKIYEKYFGDELKNIPINANVEYILAYITEISVLYLPYCQIKDISPLQHLTNLTTLNLWENEIKDISPLQHLTNLNTLDLWSNQITDISPLQNLTNLTELYLWENQITDISPLQHLTNLTELDLGKNQIIDVSPLQHLTNLTELDLEKNQITDVSPLQHLTNLTSLNLWRNKITDISSLQHLTNLTSLNLDANQITDVSPLQHLTNLTSLYLKNNDIPQAQQDMLRKALPLWS